MYNCDQITSLGFDNAERRPTVYRRKGFEDRAGFQPLVTKYLAELA